MDMNINLSKQDRLDICLGLAKRIEETDIAINRIKQAFLDPRLAKTVVEGIKKEAARLKALRHRIEFGA